MLGWKVCNFDWIMDRGISEYTCSFIFWLSNLQNQFYVMYVLHWLSLQVYSTVASGSVTRLRTQLPPISLILKGCKQRVLYGEFFTLLYYF